MVILSSHFFDPMAQEACDVTKQRNKLCFYLFFVLQDDSTGEMIFDEVFHALSRCLAGLAQPFQVPGTDQLFKPKIFVTILAYSSIIGLDSHQVITVVVLKSLMGFRRDDPKQI